jgi:prolipoprotein diacylglyceryl transferase
MYPNLYYAFRDLFGVEWPFLRFVNSFGFFVAMAFLAGAAVLANELKRKSKLGLFKPTETSIVVGEAASMTDLISNFVLGFILGFKVIGLFVVDKSLTEDPQAFIFSGNGSLLWGILLGVFFLGQKWWEKNKQKLAKPENRIVRIWPQDRIGEITMLALVFGLFGAKLFDIFENWSGFLQQPAAYIFSPAGLTMYGGLICATIAIGLYAKRHQIPFLKLCDAAAPALMLAYSVGRIGCMVAGDGDWGIVSDLSKKPSFLPNWFWSYTFPHNVVEEGLPIQGCAGKFCNELPFGVYPTPLYEVLACFVLFIILWSIRKRVKTTGFIFSIYLIFNGLERFLIEKIRVNNKMDLAGFHPTQAEVIAVLLIFSGIGLYFFQRKRELVAIS